MKKFFLVLFLFFSLISVYSVASDVRVDDGVSIMENIFSETDFQNYLIKYRDDGRFIGALFLNENNFGHTIKVFNVHTQEQVFEFNDKDKKVVNFVFKRDAIVVYYKSTLWEEKIAYDLYTGRVVRRYSSWLGYN